MRHRGEINRFEVDSTSGKIRIRPKKGDRWKVIREKKDFLKFASNVTKKEWNF